MNSRCLAASGISFSERAVAHATRLSSDKAPLSPALESAPRVPHETAVRRIPLCPTHTARARPVPADTSSLPAFRMPSDSVPPPSRRQYPSARIRTCRPAPNGQWPLPRPCHKCLSVCARVFRISYRRQRYE